MRSAVPGGHLSMGEKVKFSVVEGQKGPEACNITMQSGSNGVQSQGYAAPQVPTPNNVQRFSGVVKNWNIEKGWGFIACTETMAIYSKDIFLHRNQLAGQEPGTGAPLDFSVDVGDDGRLIATHVKLKNTQHSARPQNQAWSPLGYNWSPAANYWSPY
mmetsp:Transcript_98038/g.154503  ORF Transcript_98038/g.154503 Transcript_98038/m.154503 type:complete len:158 (+) Transcript_98038:2-475(+)